MSDLTYRIILRPEPEGGYTVTVPALPGCVTYGSTVEEANMMAANAVNAYLVSMRKHAEPVVDDSGTFESQFLVEYA
jgi:antitoxin HicB